MLNKRKNGSFYTPKIISDFLVDYISVKLEGSSSISVLEPSAGDGIFIESILSHKEFSNKVKKIVAVEKNKNELNKITRAIRNKSFLGVHSDFLDFQEKNKDRFQLVIGNPPYIRNSLLKKHQVEKCKAIHSRAKLSTNKPKNIWTSFLVRCIEFTNDDGILAFVLPSELLQVKFAAELRELIINSFERVEIFTFNELLFKDCKGQDTLLLIAQRKASSKGVFYCNIDKVEGLSKNQFILAQNVKIKESKWTHHHLDTSEIELLEKLKQRLQTIDNYCDSKAGIVTAANDFFIVTENEIDKYSLHQFVKPIIQKGAFVNGSVVLTEVEFQMLVSQSKPTFLLALDSRTRIRRNAKLWNYLAMGKELKLDERYKTSIRNNWFEVPNIGNPSEALFFKRCNEYPKLIKNEAQVLSTDSAYTIGMRNGFKIESLIFSFYNSLTLAFAELQGRYYGGGVLELTPNEFKKLPVPYVRINNNHFASYVRDFKNKTSIRDICRVNDVAILKSIDEKLDDDSIHKLFNIREKLYLRRIKTN